MEEDDGRKYHRKKQGWKVRRKEIPIERKKGREWKKEGRWGKMMEGSTIERKKERK